MRVHIDKTESFHGDADPSDFDPPAAEAATFDRWRDAIRARVSDEVEDWLVDGRPTYSVSVSVSLSEYEAYRERAGLPSLPLDPFGDG